MGAIKRAVGNVFRKKVRSIFVILVIGFCIAIFITMYLVASSIGANAGFVSADAATLVTVSAESSHGGFGGFGGGGTEMNQGVLNIVTTHDADVTAVQPVISEFQQGSSGGFFGGLMISGEDPSEPLILAGGGSYTLTSGANLTSAEASSADAMVGAGYASSNGITYPGSITLNGTSFTVVGIYSASENFENNSAIIPYNEAKKVYAATGPNELYVTVDYVQNVNTVVNNIQTTLNNAGSPYNTYVAESVSSEQQNILSYLDSIVQSSEEAFVVAAITASAVMVFVMILVTRERTKEIGVLKAIGFKSRTIVVQFFTESLVLALIGFGAAIAIVAVFGQYLSRILQSTTGRGGFGGGFGGGGFYPGGGPGGGSALSATSILVHPDLLVYALLLTIAMGIVGSLYPIVSAMRLKPAEALRYD